MMSKKDAITLGVLAIGGVAVASAVAGGGDSGGVTPRAGGILGTPMGGATIYNLPAQPSVTFPKAPTFDIGSYLGTPAVPVAPAKDPVDVWYEEHAGAAYLPRRWEVKKMLTQADRGVVTEKTGRVALGYEGYVTPKTPTPFKPVITKKEAAPPTYMPAWSLPAAIGFSTALSYARGSQGVSAVPTKKEEHAT